MAKRLDRQLDIIKSVDMRKQITVLGAGGIGSWTVLMLAKMGCTNILVIDDDRVEDHNVASQFFKESQLGEFKVDALKDSVLEQTGIEINTSTENLDEEYISSGILIMALDSMKERIRLGKIYSNRDLFIIDGRMGGLSMEIYASESSKYLDTTVPPEEVEAVSCTNKAISFNCSVIAGMIVNIVRKELTNNSPFRGELYFCFNSLSFILIENNSSQDTIEVPGLMHGEDVLEPTTDATVDLGLL